MKIKENQHLTYCLNVHSGETWDENLAAIKKFTLPIQNTISKNEPFGLGLRLSNDAATTLSDPQRLSEFIQFLADNNLYVFTVNAFPFGIFHKERVKENVYLPDWRYNERYDYTIKVADILASIIPKGSAASISTVPCSYKSWIKTETDITSMVTRLMDSVAYLAQLAELLNRHIHLGLEPEPDCYLETTDDVIQFFTGPIKKEGAPYLAFKMKITENAANALIKRHLGICFDTCHLALQFEDLAESIKKISDAGILISKIQISSALCTNNSDTARKELAAFCDPVYLHQVKAKTSGNELASYTDLDRAIHMSTPNDKEEWRIHFHVPLYFEQYGTLQSTINELTPEFFNAIKNIPHLEIETYTFDVLPPNLRAIGITESIIKEYNWVETNNITANGNSKNEK
jgi:sugar phosphate isomerase/epimerase